MNIHKINFSKNTLTFYLIFSAFVSFAQNKKSSGERISTALNTSISTPLTTSSRTSSSERSRISSDERSRISSDERSRIIDSLQQALKNHDAQKLELHKNLLPDESDTSKVNTLNALSWQFIFISEFDSARKYVDVALAIAQQINYKKGIANSYNYIGSIYYSQGNYQEALKNHFASLKIKEEVGDKKGIANSCNNLGIIYNVLGNYSEALKYHLICLKIAEEFGNKGRMATSYNNIGNVYHEQRNYPEALKNYIISLKLSEEIGNKTGVADGYGNIGVVYKDQGNNSEALKNYLAALKIFEEIGDKKGVAITYNNIGLIYKVQGNYSEALKNYFTSLKIKEEIGDKNGIATCFIDIGSAKLKMQSPGEGKDWLMKGLKLAKEMDAIPIMEAAYEGLAIADSALGNFKGAYENHKLFMLYRDSLINEENTKKITQQQMQYDFDKEVAEKKSEQEKKDALASAELDRIKHQRYFLFGAFFFAIIFAFLDNRKKKRITNEKKRSEELLLNILPGEVADEIKNTGTAKAKAFTMVTVMFTDFKDFTTVSEKISAELLVEEIHTCFSAFDNILHKYKIEKIKTIGDAYLCASGLPISNHTHATDMINCAFEIRSYMQQRKKEKVARGEIPFELRIGIHTGPVVAGVVGVKKYAYDIWGDTVNIAARMEQNSEADKINISGATYELVKDNPMAIGFKCVHRGKITAKNKGEIDMYFVEGPNT